MRNAYGRAMTTPTVAARGLWRSSHPGPTCVVTVLALALGIAAGLDAWRLVLLTLAVFAGQLSVGISNDAIDVARDRAVGRDDKPIARGEVSMRAAWAAAIGCLAVALLLSAPLGMGMLAVHALTLVSAWSYNAGLKATVFSLVPFLVSFGLFPSLATLSAADPRMAAGWAGVAGAALGAAVHLTNVLPDLEDDRRTGIRGLPHRLGGPASAVLAAVCVAIGGVAVLLGPVGFEVGEVGPLAWGFCVAVLAVAAAGAVAALRGVAGRAVFRLVMLSALLLAVQLVATGGALAA